MPNSPVLRRAAIPASVTAAALAAFALAATPAHAAAVRVSPTSGVNPAGQTVTVSGSGFDADRNNGFGVYVVFGPRRADWVTDSNAYLAARWVHRGASGSGGQAPMSSSGGFSVSLSVKAKYTDGSGRKVDCLKTQCYVMTMAAHGVPDRSQDTATPIRFTGSGPGSGGGTGSGGGAGTGGSSGTGTGGGTSSGSGTGAQGGAGGSAPAGGPSSTASGAPSAVAAPGAVSPDGLSPAGAFEQTPSGGRAGSPWPFWAVTGAAVLAVPAARHVARRRGAHRRNPS
ncbi:hypothetical protein AGRA3207_003321 [Actinomadura graeca]|uniref:IPT/TIG domain-containing protein n=1 Tax=Actinomadura graeca TaxID=2750812 RepID=A0ABX8QUC3_9ACTN|nr:hypothetical protein [Actinomadura graeca]QXJ22335.1 hypothetical protein AGRA3207_003321 [Actinomadura graeca]